MCTSVLLSVAGAIFWLAIQVMGRAYQGRNMRNKGYVENMRLYKQVADQIASDIRSGVIAPNTKLPPERVLSERYGASRPTIREAVIALDVAGLVALHPNRGVMVVTPDDDDGNHDDGLLKANEKLDLFEIIEARIVFEGEAAALAAAKRNDLDLEQLRRALAKIAEVSGEGIVARTADADFHLTIARATGNAFVTRTVESLWRLRDASQLSAKLLKEAHKRGIKTPVDDHEKIFSAIEQGNPDLARSTMRSHLERSAATILTMFKYDAMERVEAEIAIHEKRLAIGSKE